MDNTVVHKYNILNHIPREHGHQLGSNLNVSSVPVFYGSRTSPIAFLYDARTVSHLSEVMKKQQNV